MHRSLPVLTLFLAACSADPPAPEPVFPIGVESWAEGRACLQSHEHELRFVRVVTDAAAAGPYQALAAGVTPSAPYPEGATLVKLEYDGLGCVNFLGYTAMQKLAPGQAPAARDWRWQRVDAKRKVMEDGAPATCTGCHRHHCEEPQCGYPHCGYDWTCGVEP